MLIREECQVGRQGFDELVPDPAWSGDDSRDARIHRIHAYPAKFPSFIARKCFALARERGLQSPIVGDFFCGCGTVASEARRYGFPFWGCDINPVAALIARTKATSFCPTTIDRHAASIAREFRRARGRLQFSDTAKARIDYWYPERQYRALSRLLIAIRRAVPSNSRYRDFFFTAFSNILKPTSRWLTKSIKPQVDPKKTPAKVFDCFARQVQLMRAAYSDHGYSVRERAHIVNCDFLNTRITIPRLDLVITSPPYVTSYEYADLHQLSALWLGYADDYRTLREGAIGSSYKAPGFSTIVSGLNPVGAEIAYSLYATSKQHASKVARYFQKMEQVAARASEVIAHNGLLCMVVGNTEYAGVTVDNARHITHSLLDNGFKNVQIIKRKIGRKILTPYRDTRGQFSSKSTGREVYSQEFIIIGTRP